MKLLENMLNKIGREIEPTDKKRFNDCTLLNYLDWLIILTMGNITSRLIR